MWIHPCDPQPNDGPGAQMIDLIFEGQPVKKEGPFHQGPGHWGSTCIYKYIYIYMGVSKNNGTVSPNHPFLTGFSIINHPFWGTPFFWKHPYIYTCNRYRGGPNNMNQRLVDGECWWFILSARDSDIIPLAYA